MSTRDVRIPITGTIVLRVDAESEEEAEQKAREALRQANCDWEGDETTWEEVSTVVDGQRWGATIQWTYRYQRARDVEKDDNQ